MLSLLPPLGESDPLLKQLNPVLNSRASNRDALRSFFSIPPAATQATTSDGVHYLRTLNPMNPENLAVYPRRLGSNRPNPYMKPRGYDNLPEGLLSYDTRHCRNGNPVTQPAGELAAALQQTLPILQNTVQQVTTNPLAPPPPTPNGLANNITNFVFNNAGRNIPAPRCVDQGPFTVNEGKLTTRGETTKFPHVREARSSTSTPQG